jgi:hypothetical protein
LVSVVVITTTPKKNAKAAVVRETE